MNLQQKNSQVLWSTSHFIFGMVQFSADIQSKLPCSDKKCQQAEGSTAGERGGGEQDFLNRYPKGEKFKDKTLNNDLLFRRFLLLQQHAAEPDVRGEGENFSG